MQNTSKIKVIVFDWDGVIVDSMPMFAKGIQETAASYGVQISAEKILATYFQPKEAFYKSIGIAPEDIDELDARHAANDEKYLESPKPFDDVLPALVQLSNKGLKLGIATSRKEAGIIGIHSEIETNNLQKFFPLENVQSGKSPKEEKLAALIGKFGVAPNEFLYVGDLPSDITVAKKVGAKSAGISRHSPMGLESAGQATKSADSGQATKSADSGQATKSADSGQATKSADSPVDGPATARLKAENPDYFLNSLSDLLTI